MLLAALRARQDRVRRLGRDRRPHDTVVAPNGAEAEAAIGLDGVVRVQLSCGSVLDHVVLRSYVIGAVHMALGWVTSEGLAVDADGTIGDLTIRSFGVLRASDMPLVEVALHEGPGEPVNGSDAVFGRWRRPPGRSRAGPRTGPRPVAPGRGCATVKR